MSLSGAIQACENQLIILEYRREETKSEEEKSWFTQMILTTRKELEAYYLAYDLEKQDQADLTNDIAIAAIATAPPPSIVTLNKPIMTAPSPTFAPTDTSPEALITRHNQKQTEMLADLHNQSRKK